MADRPIIFSAPMVQALLAGRKTQTRRVLKPQPTIFPSLAPSFSWGKFFGMWPDDWFGHGNEIDGALPYAPGDRLWVRETWRTDVEWDDCPPREFDASDAIHYEADAEQRLSLWGDPFYPGRTRSPIHMPRWVSRLTIVVSDVRVQRVQEITPADAIAEGCPPYANSQTIDCETPNPRDDFRGIWNSIHGPDAWDANPWVAAITFTVHKCNIDQMEAA